MAMSSMSYFDIRKVMKLSAPAHCGKWRYATRVASGEPLCSNIDAA
jgi:hypothetical protein